MGKKQYAALPFCKRNSGIKIMLITTRNKGRWSIPKGGAIGNGKPHRTAAIEAYEEAGLVGAVDKRRVGKFKHRKGKGADKQTLQVSVFPMKVSRRERWWPEKGQRKAIWVSVDAARGMVHKEELRQLIARFAEGI
jgi:8-oxo-dGTP pyrophosphatase MutT (NUDIX family)